MEVIKYNSVPEQDATDAPLFFGGAVSRQPIISGGKSSYYNFSQVNFAAGAKNKFHTHTSDQILYVTKGTGIVANESEEIEISEGDTAFIPSGEKHWHGATDHSAFSHISLTHPESKTEMFD
ncbi:MAG: cupin domain-containing protein [Chloroflexi bacterium]|nr:cupin domain-containing protein [Chloroflexota bacterium]